MNHKTNTEVLRNEILLLYRQRKEEPDPFKIRELKTKIDRKLRQWADMVIEKKGTGDTN